MSLIIDGTEIKKIIYDEVEIKKAYCDDIEVFTSERVVTYQIKGVTWTAIVGGGDSAITTNAVEIATAKMGDGDSLLGWTTVDGSTTPMEDIPVEDDGLIVYGIWKHAHVGRNYEKGGCYQGAEDTMPPVISDATPVVREACGCTTNSWNRHCPICGAVWHVECLNGGYCTNSPKHYNGQVIYPGERSACPNGHTMKTYAISCGKSAGTFCG